MSSILYKINPAILTNNDCPFVDVIMPTAIIKTVESKIA